MKVLSKILVQDYETLIRAAFAEDIAYLNMFSSNHAIGLDLATNDMMSAINEGDLFFRIENYAGAYVGFFTFPVLFSTMSFHIRKGPFRTAEYFTAFWQLVNETFNNNLFTSIGANNLTKIPGILTSTFTIKNNLEYHGKKFILLKQSI